MINLRDEIKVGNLSVTHSKRFGRLDEFFIPQQRWRSMQGDFFRRSGLPAKPSAVRDHLRQRLNEAVDRFLAATPNNSYAVVDEQGWHHSGRRTIPAICRYL